MRIIVDVMGGDKAPNETVKGVYASSVENPGVEYTLVGDIDKIRGVAQDCNIDISNFKIEHTKEFITMDDDPLCIRRAKAESSMAIGLKLLAQGEGDAFVSAGNTGALFIGSNLIVRRSKGVKRAAIGALLPMDPPVLLLDSGANINLEAEDLEQFAVMGSAYARTVYGNEKPRVGLLNNGIEESKGTELQRNAYKLLSKCPIINFVGNVEGNAVMENRCDVLVTDGFSGNVLLKGIEGTGKMLLHAIKNMFTQSIKTKMGFLLLKNGLMDMVKVYDPSEYGGAPILGIAKPVIKAHGSSDSKSFKNAIKQAIFCAKEEMTDTVCREMQELNKIKKESEISDKPEEKSE